MVSSEENVMKRHIGILLFYAGFSFLVVELFFRYQYEIDLFVMFALGAMITGWILNLSPQIKIWFLSWTLVCGAVFCFYIYQESAAYNNASPSTYSKTFTMGYFHTKNISVRNYSLHRKREIEKRKKIKEQMKNNTGRSGAGYSGSSGSSYSGGSSHYGGGLSGGK